MAVGRDDQLEEVLVESLVEVVPGMEGRIGVEMTGRSTRPKAVKEGDITTAMPGTVIKVKVKIGDRGETVKLLQVALRAAGFDATKEAGVYGRETERQVMAFQKASGLPASGRVDADTLCALDRKIAECRAKEKDVAAAAPEERVDFSGDGII